MHTHRVTTSLRVALLGAALAAPHLAPGQSPQDRAPVTRYVLEADLGRDTISRHIYGQFAEHLGRLVYDGVWTRTSPAEPWGMRKDVL